MEIADRQPILSETFIWKWMVIVATASARMFLSCHFAINPADLLWVTFPAMLAFVASFAVARTSAMAWIARAVRAMAVFSLLSFLIAIFAQCAATRDAPLEDGLMLRADRFIGYDWHVMARFMVHEPVLSHLLSSVYWSLVIQPVMIMGLLAFFRKEGELNGYVMASSFGLAVTVAIFSFVPVTTAWIYERVPDAELLRLHLATAHGGWVGHLLELRAGGHTSSFDVNSGVVGFPSFHACSAVVNAWSLLRIRVARWPACLVNGLMIVATPYFGGHYLVDVLAGIAVAVFSIMVTDCLRHTHASIFIRPARPGAPWRHRLPG
jgi:hypothetical protein